MSNSYPFFQANDNLPGGRSSFPDEEEEEEIQHDYMSLYEPILLRRNSESIHKRRIANLMELLTTNPKDQRMVVEIPAKNKDYILEHGSRSILGKTPQLQQDEPHRQAAQRNVLGPQSEAALSNSSHFDTRFHEKDRATLGSLQEQQKSSTNMFFRSKGKTNSALDEFVIIERATNKILDENERNRSARTMKELTTSIATNKATTQDDPSNKNGSVAKPTIKGCESLARKKEQKSGPQKGNEQKKAAQAERDSQLSSLASAVAIAVAADATHTHTHTHTHTPPSPQSKTCVAKKNTHIAQWENSFQRLVEYKKVHGHTLVPNYYTNDIQLGNWVRNQRHNQKNGSMSKERKRKLDQIGFLWVLYDSGISRWDEMFGRLKAYKDEHGNTSVPLRYAKDTQLGAWVNYQRTSRRKGKLSAQKVDMLKALNFEWDPQKHAISWDQMFWRLVAYKKIYGHVRVPFRYKVDPQLGYWVSNQKAFYRKERLSPERTILLESIGLFPRNTKAKHSDPAVGMK